MSAAVCRPAVTLRRAALDLAAIRARCPERIEHAAIYEALAAGGAEYGEAYRLIRRLARADGEVLADLAPDPRGAGWSPTLLDAAFQVTFALAVEKGGLLPFTIDRLAVHGALSDAAHVHGLRREAGKGYVRLDLTITDRDGAVLAAVNGFVARMAASAAPTLPLRLLAPVWRVSTRPQSVPQGRLLIVTDEGGRALADDVAAAWPGEAAEVVASLPSTTAADHVWLVTAPRIDGGEIGLVVRLAETIRTLAALPKPPKVTVVTVGAHAVRDDEVPNAGAAAIAAFAKSAGREHPAFRLRVIDIEPDAPVAALVALPHEEGEIAWRERYGLDQALPTDFLAGAGQRRGGRAAST